MTLLLAESDPALRSHFESYFRSIGFVVETASDGLQCLDLLRQRRPEALILDLDLPWGGGDGVLARLAQGDAPRPRAIIAVGSNEPAGLADRVGIAPVAFLSKPVHASSLVVLIATELFGADLKPPRLPVAN